MKIIVVSLSILISTFQLIAQQSNWTDVEKILGRSGNEQGGVFKVTFPRTDLKVKIGDFAMSPGLALTSWAGFLGMGDKSGGSMNNEVMMMGDLVLPDSEVPAVISKLISSGLAVTAVHNHLVGESPAIKYIHFSGHGTATGLAGSIKSVLSATGTPMATQAQNSQGSTDWSAVQAVLGKGNPKGILLQYGFPRREKLTESGMEIPPFMGMATSVNFQKEGDNAAITGDFVLIADEVNPVVRALTDNGIVVTALHNHMLYDNPRLFMMHFWAVGDPARLAKGIKSALDRTNSVL